MSSRPFPSFRLYKDHRDRWRWRYERSEHEPLAVSPDGYESRVECEQMVALLRRSVDAPIWIAARDREAAAANVVVLDRETRRARAGVER